MLRARVVDCIWFLFLAIASSGYVWSASRQIGATFDEPFYVATGLDCWRTGSYRPLMTKGTMPLPVDIQTLPLFVWECHRGEPIANPYADFPSLLPIARVMNLPFWWLLLFYGWRWGRALSGRWGGLLATALLASEPNLLAHAMLATTDIALTAMVLAASFHWFAGRTERWPKRVLIPGLWYGLALASKASAFAFVPIIWLVLGVWSLALTETLSWRTLWSDTRRLRWDLVLALSLGCVVVFAYCGCDWQTEPTFVAWAHTLPESPTKSTMIVVSEHLSIFPNAGEGLVQQIKHNFRGHGAYVLGQYHPRAVWYYFPVVLSIKLSLSVVLLLVVGLLTRSRSLWNPATAITLALLVFSLNARVQIGIRLVLPLVAFLLVALAVALTRPSTSGNRPWVERFRLGLVVLALLVNLVTLGRVWPDPLRHINDFWGGPDRGERWVADSNYDWGQGLPDLRDWWTTHEQPRLHVWYYGADPDVYRTPFQLLEVHRMTGATPEQVRAAVGDGLLAVSVSLLVACPDRKSETLAVLDWLRMLEPVARTQTFVLYSFRAPR